MRVDPPAWTETDFYRRGAATLLASWREYARGSAGAELVSRAGFTASVFPNEPERSIYNNVLVRRGLGRAERVDAIDGIRSVYSRAGVDSYAVWAHESDDPLRGELSARG